VLIIYFSSVTTGDQDQHGAWRDVLLQRMFVLRERLGVGSQLLWFILGRVKFRLKYSIMIHLINDDFKFDFFLDYFLNRLNNLQIY
jgi:hypothetical protein